MTKFDSLLEGLGWTFSEDNLQIGNKHYYTKDDLLELLTEAYNMGVQNAADNADADLTILSGQGQYDLQRLVKGEDYEVYVIKDSILNLKL